MGLLDKLNLIKPNYQVKAQLPIDHKEKILSELSNKLPDELPDELPEGVPAAIGELGAEQVAALLRALDQDAYRSSLAEFIAAAWVLISPSTPLEWGPHLDAICLHLQGQLEDMAARRADPESPIRAQNLLINCPPRSLKTILLALANAWAWLRWPWVQILYLSANPRVVLDSARLFRLVISSAWYRDLLVVDGAAAWDVREDQDALSSIGNTAGGARRSAGFRSELIGANSDWLVVDDAHSMDDSDDMIQSAIDNYDLNLSSRMNDPRSGIRTGIMQRAKRNDFSEHVLQQGWFHLRMPMEYEREPECQCSQCSAGARGEPNAFGWRDWRTAEGEILHPRFTREYLSERMKVLRPHGYAGQMQQRPSAREGNQFKVGMWRYHQVGGDGAPRARPPGANIDAALLIGRKSNGWLDVDWVCLSVDPTGGSTSGTASALGMAVVAGKAERRHVLEDLTPGPRTWLEHVKDIPAALARASDITGWTNKILVLVEKKALGEAAMRQLEEAIGSGQVRNSRGDTVTASVKPYEPSGKGDKEKRADVLEPMLDAGLITLADGAPWLAQAPHGSDQTWVDEFSAFPRGHRDDRVDVLAQCCDHYRQEKPGPTSSQWMAFARGMGRR